MVPGSILRIHLVSGFFLFGFGDFVVVVIDRDVLQGLNIVVKIDPVFFSFLMSVGLLVPVAFLWDPLGQEGLHYGDVGRAQLVDWGGIVQIGDFHFLG